jgi:predicted metal-dependent phosphoesterase TrpH
MSHRRLDTRVDLHLHTTWSDGTYTPPQVVDLARRSGLAAIALTDHDTVAGLAEARAAAGPDLETVSGVEITSLWRGRGLHLLGYFFRPDDSGLLAGLEMLREQRLGRFREMAQRLRDLGAGVPEAAEQELVNSGSLGRRHLATLLVKAGRAASERQAFRRYLGDKKGVAGPVGLPAATAIAMVRQAGGVVALAHPPYDFTRERLADLRRLGVQAVEVEYPARSPRRSRELRRWAAELGLAVTGGSDCHGPNPWQHAVGARSVTLHELDALRRLAPG